ncbi:MAG: hypothetical protein M3Z13_03975 [Candidatus Dormibacteraeota bacterium]|nr:hypothetical protein [Candidatus Dormibacteraeota bacterium]
MIACIRTPHLSLAAAWLTIPALRNQALVLGGHANERGTVIAASDEARALGVRAGKSLNQAQQVAPDAIFQPVDEATTARVRARLLATLHGISPEVAAADEPGYAFLKLDGLALRWPDRRRLLEEIVRRVESSIAVQPAIGVGGTMFVSRVAADQAEPHAPVLVETSQTRAYLAPLPIDVLPIDKDLHQYLELLGLRTLGALQAIARPSFRRQFGIKALEAYDLALGIDRRRLRTWRPAHRIEESQPLEPPIEDTQALQFLARALSERISESLLAAGLGTRLIRIVLDQEAAGPLRIEVSFAYPVTMTGEIFDGIRPRLLKASIAAPLERITMRAGRLEPGYVRQPGLLLRRDGFQESLADAIARLQEEYRPELVQRASLRQDAPPLSDRRILWKPA